MANNESWPPPSWPVNDVRNLNATQVNLYATEIDPSYKNVKWFNGETDKSVYYNSFSTLQFTNQSYMRIDNKGSKNIPRYTMRLQEKYDKICEYNYIRIINPLLKVTTGQTEKWWNNGSGGTTANGFPIYCFIKDVRYIFLNVTEIEFELDVMTTYMGYFSINPSYVLRRTYGIDEDVNFANTEPEPFNIDKYVIEPEKPAPRFIRASTAYSDLDPPDYTPTAYIVALCTENITGSLTQPTQIEGVFNGLYIYQVPYNDYNLISEFLTNVSNDQNKVVQIMMTPFNILSPPNYGSIQYQGVFTPSSGHAATSIDGYEFHNKKLNNYPFRKFLLGTVNGEQKTYCPELFNVNEDNNIIFNGRAYGGLDPFIVCDLPDYNKLDTTGNGSSFYQNAVFFKCNPQCAWSGDAFKQWLSTKGTMFGLQALFNIALMHTGAGALSGGMALLGQAAEFAQAVSAPDTFKGSLNSEAAPYNLNMIGFYFCCHTCTQDMAKTVDSYFDAYGYAENKILNEAQMNLNSRKYWNYIQLKDCSIRTNSGAFGKRLIPYDHQIEIQNIFNNGVRLWHLSTSADDINFGDLSIDNYIE